MSENNTPIVFSIFDHTNLAQQIASALAAPSGEFTYHQFPDGESYVQVTTDCTDRRAIIVANLHHPDAKLLPLAFLADAIRSRGAAEVTLVAPYLPYMRQDKQFHEGECVTSRIFAHLLSQTVDRLITIDPHLHRYHALDEIYTIPTSVLSAMSEVARWIKNHIPQPLIIGPDSESEQWAKATAKQIDCEFLIMEKHRYGDRNVEVDMPDLSAYAGHTPVLVDDIISTGRTMLETANNLNKMGLKAPVCIGVHAVCGDEDYHRLKQGYVERVVSCDTIVHESNGISLAERIAGSLRSI